MTNILHKISPKTKRIIAAVLSLVLVLGAVSFIAPVEAQALSINASDSGFYNVAYGTDGETTFGTGTKIRVLNQTLIAKNKGKSDAVYTLGTDGWTADNTLVWDGTGENTIYGVYPYNASYDEFTIPTDQSGGVQDADWMTATYTGTKTDSVGLDFSHLLTKVTVRIATWNSEYGGIAQSINDARIYSLSTGIEKNDDGAAAADQAQLTGITPLEDGISYTAIVCPGKYTSDQAIMTFRVNDEVNEHTVLAKNNTALTTEGLQPGYHYTFNLTVGKNAVTLTSVDVTDWVEEDIAGGVAEEADYTYNESTNTYTVYTHNGLQAALANGGNIILGDNIEYTGTAASYNSPFIVSGSTQVVLDLNGKTLSVPEWNGLYVMEGGTLTINDNVGSGKVDAGVCAVVGMGMLVINGGKYSGGDYSLWLGRGSPNATINNGTFEGVGVNGGQLTVNGGTIETFEFYSTVVITGGTHGSDPTSYVDTEKYTVTNNGDGTYTVTAK